MYECIRALCRTVQMHFLLFILLCRNSFFLRAKEMIKQPFIIPSLNEFYLTFELLKITADKTYIAYVHNTVS